MTEFTAEDIEHYRKQYALWTSRRQTTPEEIHLIARLRDAIDEIERLKAENDKQKIAIANQGKIINQYQKQSTDLQYELDTIKNNPEAEKYYFEKWTELKQRIVELEEALAKIASYESMRFRISPFEYGVLEQIVGIAEHAIRDGE